MKIISSPKINAKLKALLKKAKGFEEQDEYIVDTLIENIGKILDACHIRILEDQFPENQDVMMDEGINLAFKAKGKPIIKATLEVGDKTCGDENHFYWLAKEADILKALGKIEIKPDEDEDNVGDDLCDTCGRSGIVVARTKNGKTVCVDCDDDEDEEEEDEDDADDSDD